jgi:hypothetical protein
VLINWITTNIDSILLVKGNSIMKKSLRTLLATVLLVLSSQGFFTQSAFGQFAPPPPPPPEVKGSSGNHGPSNEGAPIGDGAWILITLVVGYGIHTYKSHKRNHQDEIDKE